MTILDEFDPVGERDAPVDLKIRFTKIQPLDFRFVCPIRLLNW